VEAPAPLDTTGSVSLLERHDMIVERLRAGTLGVKEYRKEFARFLENKDAIYKELDARICQMLIERWGLKWPERAVPERQMLTQAMFLGLVYDYMLVRTHSHASFDDEIVQFMTKWSAEMVKSTPSSALDEYAELIRRAPRKKGHGYVEIPCSTSHASTAAWPREITEHGGGKSSNRSQRRLRLKR
jgi:hypothetical protein